jgi:bifunctional non-homologous end joining protein LigD
MKLDGFRALARREGERVDLLSRTGPSLAGSFPEIVGALKRIPGDWW